MAESAFCTLQWGVSPPEWDAGFQTIRQSTLLQSLPYAHAMREIHQQQSRFGRILMNGEAAGLIRLGEVGLLKNTIHAVTLDRGPLWFDGFGHHDHWVAFEACFDRTFPKRFLRKRRIIAETDNPNHIQKNRLIPPPYQTIWLDLRPPLADLRAGLKQKWRNTLNKAERSNLEIKVSFKGEDLSAVLHGYALDRVHKKYAGASLKFLESLCHFTVPRGECLTLIALDDGAICAACLVFLHGQSATYQMGWTSRMGRSLGAHQRLLWVAIETLCHKKILDFDLGGINDHSAAGVKAFKQGLGGEEITLIGRYE